MKIKIFILTTVFVLLACLLAYTIRFHFLQTLSIRLDESQSIHQALFPLFGKENLFKFMASDVHPPLYVLMLHFWIIKFGTGVMQTRFLSLIIGMLTVPIMYFLTKEIYSKKEAIISTLLTAVSPLFVWYSLEDKNYALLLFSTALSFLFFYKIVHNKNNKIYYPLYLFAQVLGMYSHYFFVFVLFTQAFGAIIYKKKSIIILNLIAFIFFLPWVLYFLKYHSASTQPALGGIDLFNLILNYFELIAGYHSSFFYSIAIAVWPLVILFSFIYIRAFKKVNKDTLILIFGAVVPITLTFLISKLIIPIFLTRYLVFVLIFLSILISRAIMSSKTMTFKVLASMLFVILLGTLSYTQMTDFQNISNEDYRDSIAYIESKSTRNDLIVVSASFTIYPFDYYYKGVSNYTTLPYWDMKKAINFAPTSSQIQTLVDEARKKYKNIYLLESFDQTPNNSTVKWFNDHLQKIDQKNFGYNVNVYEYKIGYSKTPNLQQTNTGKEVKLTD